MSKEDQKQKPAINERPIEVPGRMRANESIANRQDRALDKPITKFESPNPWPDPKEPKKK